MRCFWKLFAVFAAVLLMTATAAAAEADTGEFRYECESMVEAEPVAMMCAEPAWSSADVGYGDQLHGDADLAYTAIADAFANGNVVLKGEFWSAGVALKKSFTSDALGSFSGTREQYDELVNEVVQAATPGLAADVSKAGFAFVYDHPEYFWIRTDMAMSAGAMAVGDRVTIEIEMLFSRLPECDTAAEIAALQEQVDAVVELHLETAQGMSDVAKLAYFDNWLAENNAYNGEALDLGYRGYIAQNSEAAPWTAIGGLLPGFQPVCEGYSHALQLLCKRSGISCVPVTGLADGGEHMWVAVKLDGNWFMIDSTWNDPGEDESSAAASVRSCFLSALPDSHQVRDSVGLVSPTVSAKGYLDWSRTEVVADGVFGGCVFSGNNVCWVALYDTECKMVAVRACDSFAWIGTQMMCVAPKFEAQELRAAVSARLFCLGRDSWVPAYAARPLGT